MVDGPIPISIRTTRLRLQNRLLSATILGVVIIVALAAVARGLSTKPAPTTPTVEAVEALLGPYRRLTPWRVDMLVFVAVGVAAATGLVVGRAAPVGPAG